MPPREMFTPTKVFIKPKDQPEAEWQELLKAEIVNTTLVPEESMERVAPTMTTTGTFTFVVKAEWENGTALIEKIEAIYERKVHERFIKHPQPKKPRLTYKTIKRNCAKRNK